MRCARIWRRFNLVLLLVLSDIVRNPRIVGVNVKVINNVASAQSEVQRMADREL